jgi:hypothetical protein
MSMKCKKTTTALFYNSIKKEYQEFSEKKKNNRKVYTHEYIVSEIAIKYFRSERTIENIIFNRV